MEKKLVGNFLKKDLFIYWKVRYTKGRRDRKEDLLSDDSLPKWPQRLQLSQSEARSLKPLPDLPCGCRVPRLWAILDCFPRSQAGSWMGSRAVGIRTNTHVGSWHVQGKDFNHYAIVLGPTSSYFFMLSRSQLEGGMIHRY